MPTFYEWLQELRDDDSAFGDLARTAYLDSRRPQENTLAAWEAHMLARGGSYEVTKLIREAWQLYEAGDAPPRRREHSETGTIEPPRQRYRLRPKDDRWTIRRPMLPSWMTSIPALAHVRQTLPDYNRPLDVVTVVGDDYCAAVEQMARYFRREFHYDFLAYTARYHREQGDQAIQPYLFFDRNDVNDLVIRPIGACSFSYNQAASKWSLGWIWFHPFARRQGHLTRAWPQFRERYGSFTLAPPLSDAMAAFVQKVNPGADAPA